ncbi:hypothetical protein OROMI_031910 [Orobanche minor]
MEEKFHKIKLIRFQGRSIRILLQNEDGPCALLAIWYYHGWIVDPEDSETYNAVGSKSYDSIMLDIATSEAGTVVSEDEKRPGKDSVDIFAATTATIGVPSPGLSKGISCDDSTGSVSKHNKDRKGDLEENSNLQRALELSKVNFSDSPEDESLDSSNAKKDLEEEDKLPRATELSYGITAQNFPFGGQIYLLLTNEAYIDKPDLVWEMLNRVDGNTTFVNGSFEEVTERVASFNDAAQDNSASLSDLTLERALQEREA